MTYPNVPSGQAPILWGSSPPFFCSVFGLSYNSTQADNPYHVAVSILAQIFYDNVDERTVYRFLSFVGQIDARYKCLLDKKEPRALLLLCYWYAKIAMSASWWQRKRSIVEGLFAFIWRHSVRIMIASWVLGRCSNGHKNVLCRGTGWWFHQIEIYLSILKPTV